MSNYNRGWDLAVSHDAEPKYKGLRNRGSTCYLNSVLQVLFMTKEFRGAVQSPRNSFCQSESSHTSYIDAQLKDLFRQLKTGSPTTECIIRKLGIEYVWKQQDAAQYFDKILSLASPEASQVFHGRLIHRTTCSCGVSTFEHNSFWTLNLPINNAHNGVYNVEDGLKQFFSQSKLTGENQVYCDGCKAKADTTTECEVELYPKVLVLLLKRFEFSYYEMDYVKNDCPVDVPLNIDYIPKGVSYELYATVDHVGDLRGGHYTATIQSPDDGWYDFNDSMVTPKNNFNPIKSQKGYLLFYRKTQMSDSPQVHPHGSSVDPVESETNQNNADNGYADPDSDDSFHTPPSPSGPLDGQLGWAGRGDVTRGDEVTKGVVFTECGDVTKADDVTVGVDVTKYGEVTEVGSREPADHPVPQEASGLEGGDVTGGVEVVGGDPHPTESERVDGERKTTDVEVPTNEKESREPGDHSVPQEASGTATTVSDPEVVVNEGRGGRRESTDNLEDPGEGEKEGDVIQKTENGNTDDGNADHDSDSEANPTTPSCSGPVDKRPVWAWRGDVTGGGVREKDDVMECGDGIGVDEVKEEDDDMECDEVRASDEVVAGDPQPMEVEGLDGKGGESMTTDVEVPTNEKESREPGDQAVQPEASGTGPMVSGPEGGVNKRRRGQRECTGLLEVREEGETEGRVIKKKHRKVTPYFCFRLKKRKRGQGNKVDVVKEKQSIKERRKRMRLPGCLEKQTSDTE